MGSGFHGGLGRLFESVALLGLCGRCSAAQGVLEGSVAAKKCIKIGNKAQRGRARRGLWSRPRVPYGRVESGEK